MKYDILEPYKEFLYDQLTANTARKYYSCMVKLLQGVEINRVEELSLEYLQKELPQRFRTKNEFSAAKNALRLFGECYPQLQMPAKEYFKEESLKKRNYTKKPGKVIHLKTTMRKINQIENPKLKYAYRLAVISGLRVSDDDDKIRLNQRKPSKYKGLRRFGPEKNLQRINKFMKERPIFYKNFIQMKENFRFYLRCFYCITKVVILQFNSENRTELARNG